MTRKALRQTPLWDRIERDRPRVAFLFASFFVVVTVGLVAVIVGPSVFFGNLNGRVPYLSAGITYAVGGVALGIGAFNVLGLRAPRIRTATNVVKNRVDGLMMVLVAIGYFGLQAIGGVLGLMLYAYLNFKMLGDVPFFDWQRVLLAVPQAALTCAVWLIIVHFMDGDWAIRRLGGRPAEPHGAARAAVYGISLAAGLRTPPRVFVLETPATNAFVLHSNGNVVSIVFTRGVLDLLSQNELNAVAAVLIARLLRGRIRSTQLLGVLVGPLSLLEWPWRTLQRVFRLLRNRDFDHAAASVDGELYRWSEIAILLPGLILCFWLPVLLGVWYSITGSDTISPVAVDAESLLLGKDPASLSMALRKVNAANPAFPEVSIGFAPLFFVWPRRTPDARARELERLDALREVAGASALPIGAWNDAPLSAEFETEPLPRILTEEERLYQACMGDIETPEQ